MECPSNVTILPTLAATRPHHNITHSENKLDNNKSYNNFDNFLRHLTNSQFQSYSAALAVTIGVGCFLLLLNILIFIGIYYQRVKRTLDAKRKEEFVDSEIRIPSFLNRCLDKNGEKSSINMAQYQSNEPYADYDHYIDKMIHNESHLLATMCNAETSMDYKCKSNGNMDLLRSTNHIELQEKSTHVPIMNNSLHLHSTAYSLPQAQTSLSEAGSSNSSDLVTYQCQKNCQREIHDMHKPHTEHCNRSTQSDNLDTHDVGTTTTTTTTVTERDVDNRQNRKHELEKVPSTSSSMRSSISTTNYQGGILRQQFGPTTPSTTKKRVQIQEISV